MSLKFRHVIFFFALGILCTAGVSAYRVDAPLGAGSGTINQLTQWVVSGGYVKTASSTALLQVEGLASSDDCVVTDATGKFSTATCGIGGSGEHTDAGDYVYPNDGDYHSAPRYVATSTTASTFTYASTTGVSATTFWGNLIGNVTGALTGNVTGTASGNLISGGTLTSAYHCRWDGTGIDCDRVEDASGACGTNAVCMGGHTHVGVNEPYAVGWDADTATPEKDDVYDWGHIFDTDDDGKVNVLDVNSGIVVVGATGIVSTTTDNSTNWTTAYGWGNHASAGYITSSALTPYLSLATWYATTTHALISSLPSLSITQSQISDLDHYTDADTATYILASSTLCTTLTGSADLCDGVDASGTGGTGLATSTAIADTYVIYGTDVGTVGAEAAFTYDDATNLLTTGNASTTYTSATTFFGALVGTASGNDVLGQATSTLASHTTTYNHANYDTAYGWGDHAGAGYSKLATSTAIADTQVIYGTGVGTIGSNAGLTYDSSALLFKLSSAAAAPYLRIQGASDGDNFGALELWNSDASKKWQFAHQATGNFTFAHYSGGWASPFTIEDDNDILIGSNSLNFNTGGTSGSNYKFAQDGDDLMTIQRSGGTDTNYSLLQIKAPAANPTEATIALMTDAGSGNYRFADFYNQQYPTERQWGLRQRYSGTYAATPFMIDFYNGTVKDPMLAILPSGNVGVGVSTTTLLSSGAAFLVASTTASSSLQAVTATAFGIAGKFFANTSQIWTNLTMLFTNGITVSGGTTDLSASTVKQHAYKGVTWPGTATTTTATTSVPIGQAMVATNLEYSTCRVTSGTGSYQFSDGTNKSDYRSASTTASRYAFSTNDTYTVDENMVLEVGPMTAAQITCGVDLIHN